MVRCTAFWLCTVRFNWAPSQSSAYHVSVHCGEDKREKLIHPQGRFHKEIGNSFRIIDQYLFLNILILRCFLFLFHSLIGISFLLFSFLYPFMKFRYFIHFGDTLSLLTHNIFENIFCIISVFMYSISLYHFHHWWAACKDYFFPGVEGLVASSGGCIREPTVCTPWASREEPFCEGIFCSLELFFEATGYLLPFLNMGCI